MIYIYLCAYIVTCFLLYLAAHRSLQEVYHVLHRLTHSDHAAKVLISIWYLIGTFVHELSHFFVALILGHTVKSFSILPEFEAGGIKLGSVVYYKKDRFRSILVGIAPVFGGTAVAYGLYLLLLAYGASWGITAFLLYALFVILTNMFSSSQDLQDVIYLIPMSIFAIIIGYIVGFDLAWFAGTPVAALLSTFFVTMIQVGCVALLVHVGIWVGVRWMMGRR